MKINKALLPLKAHYFCYMGSMSPVVPSLVVVAVQLGIPVAVMGAVGAASLLLVVLMKPVLAGLADTFPSYRRSIFLMTLAVMVVSHSSLNFVTPMKGRPRLQGQLRLVQGPAGPTTPTPTPVAGEGQDLEHWGDQGQTLMLAVSEGGGCYVAEGWDCVARCEEPWSCFNTSTVSLPSSTSSLSVTVTLITHHPGLQVTKGGKETPVLHNSTALEGDWDGAPRLYRLEGLAVSQDMFPGNLSLECGRGQWEGPGCLGVWHHWQFWMFTLLLITGKIAFNTNVSFTDAIAVDSIGEEGDYGLQRAWGTVGWGLMGLISGVLVDWQSGSNVTKNYMPAFAICLILGSSDLIISAATIKVPRMTTEHNAMKAVWPILRQPRFFVFCIFVVFNGAFNGVIFIYLFMMQEKMAEGTSTINHMKFLQGMTVFVQCGIEAPFMFLNNWFMRTMGAHRVTSLVFFLYMFRLLGLAVVGAYGPVWAILLVELLNGPCFGLGYTAIVIYSSKLCPPGISTTLQSIVNICYEILGYVLAFFFGGLLFSSFGGPGLYLAAGITSAIVFILHLLSLKLLPPPQELAEENQSLGNQRVGEEEKQSPDPVVEELEESRALAGKVEGEQEAVEMNQRNK